VSDSRLRGWKIDNWYSIPCAKVHTSTCHLAMVGDRLATKGVDRECENLMGQTYVPAEMKLQYVRP
jgi:hypothetical protein